MGTEMTKYNYFNVSNSSSVGGVAELSRLFGSVIIKKTIGCSSVVLRNTTNQNITPSNFTITIGGVTQEYQGGKTIVPGSTRIFDTYNSRKMFDITDNSLNYSISSLPSGVKIEETSGFKFMYTYLAPQTPTSATIIGNDLSNEIILNSEVPGTFSKVGFSYSINSQGVSVYGTPISTKLKPNQLKGATFPLRISVQAINLESWDEGSGGVSTSIYKTIDSPISTSPTMQAFSVSEKSLDNNVSFRFEGLNYQRWELEVWQDGILKHGANANNNNGTYTIPKGLITTQNLVTAKLRLAYIPNGYLGDSTCWTYCEWREITFNPTYDNPTITNLATIGEFYEKPITVNWRSENQTGYEWEAYYNNVKVTGGTGTTAKEFVITANTYTGTLNASVRVRVKRDVAGQTLWSNWAEKNITLKEISATLDNLALSGSNIDLPITFSWSSTDQQKYEVQILKESTVAKTYTGTTATSVVIPAATLTIGLHKFRVRVAYKDRWTEWKEVAQALVETLPSIGVFEPDGIIVERDNPIRMWWTSNNQTSWKVVIDDTLTYTGTTEKEKILPAATLTTGTHKSVLEVTYRTSSGVEKKVSKKSEFIVQGKPPIPTVTSGSAFNKNRPTITWDTQDQQGYLLEVLSGSEVIYTSEWVNGLITTHTIKTYLHNGTYTVRVKVMNEFEITSEYGSQVFTVSASVTQTIPLEVRSYQSYNRLVWENSSDAFNKFYVLRNGDPIAKVTGTEYEDYTSFGEVTYTIRGINSSDNFKDSNSTTVNTQTNRGVVGLSYEPSRLYTVGLVVGDYEFNANIGIEYNLLQTVGRSGPIAVYGEAEKNVYKMKCHEENYLELLKMCRQRQVFVYRDRVQKLYLSIPTPNYSIGVTGLNYDLTCYEVDFNEVIAYD